MTNHIDGVHPDTILGRTILSTIFQDDVRNEWRPVVLAPLNTKGKMFGQVMWSRTGMLVVELICRNKPKLYGFSVARGFLSQRYYDDMQQADHDIMWHKAQIASVIVVPEHPFRHRADYYQSTLTWKD